MEQLTTYRACLCPYCRDVVLVENFCHHAWQVHDVTVPLTMTEEEIVKRYAQVGGVIFGVLSDNGKFKPELTKS